MMEDLPLRVDRIQQEAGAYRPCEDISRPLPNLKSSKEVNVAVDSLQSLHVTYQGDPSSARVQPVQTVDN